MSAIGFALLVLFSIGLIALGVWGSLASYGRALAPMEPIGAPHEAPFDDHR